MLELGNLLGGAFPEAAVLIPEARADPHADAAGAAAAGLDDAAALAARVEALAAFVRAQQQRFEIPQSDTALAGFGAGASLALAFSERARRRPGRPPAVPRRRLPGLASPAPALTTLHLLHRPGTTRLWPLARTRSDFDSPDGIRAPTPRWTWPARWAMSRIRR